jgi:DNA-binding CsgD family transcriptional regulator
MRCKKTLPHHLYPQERGVDTVKLTWLDGSTAGRRNRRAHDKLRQYLLSTFPELTQRQLHILVHLVQGRREAQVAEMLQISKETVHAHVKTLYQRVGVCSRSDLLGGMILRLIDEVPEQGGTNNGGVTVAKRRFSPVTRSIPQE